MPPVRSRIMSAIRGKHNRTTELQLRMALLRNRVRGWRLHVKTLPGTPDFYFEKEKVAVFVDGCYWHGCPKCGHVPKTRSGFWKAKIGRTQERDKKKRLELRKIGVFPLRIWEHDLKKTAGLNKAVSRILKSLRRGKTL